MGIAPGAQILSVRVLGDDGTGTYEDVIEGIQYVVANKATFDIRVMNLSLSAQATTPYFVDPLNRAVEAAWASGIVVLAAAGNKGPRRRDASPCPATTPTSSPSAPSTATARPATGPTTRWPACPPPAPPWTALSSRTSGPGGNIVSFMYNDADEPGHTSRQAGPGPSRLFAQQPACSA